MKLSENTSQDSIEKVIVEKILSHYAVKKRTGVRSVNGTVKEILLENEEARPAFVNTTDDFEDLPLDKKDGTGRYKIEMIRSAFIDNFSWAKPKNRKKTIDFLVYCRAWNVDCPSGTPSFQKIDFLNRILEALGQEKLYVFSPHEYAAMLTVLLDLKYVDYRALSERFESEANDSVPQKRASDFTVMFDEHFELITRLGDPSDPAFYDGDENISAWQFFNRYKGDFKRTRVSRYYLLLCLLQQKSLLEIEEDLTNYAAPIPQLTIEDGDLLAELLCNMDCALWREYSSRVIKKKVRSENKAKPFERADYHRYLSNQKDIPRSFILRTLAICLTDIQAKELKSVGRHPTDIVNSLLDLCGFEPIGNYRGRASKPSLEEQALFEACGELNQALKAGGTLAEYPIRNWFLQRIEQTVVSPDKRQQSYLKSWLGLVEQSEEPTP